MKVRSVGKAREEDWNVELFIENHRNTGHLKIDGEMSQTICLINIYGQVIFLEEF